MLPQPGLASYSGSGRALSRKPRSDCSRAAVEPLASSGTGAAGRARPRAGCTARRTTPTVTPHAFMGYPLSVTLAGEPGALAPGGKLTPGANAPGSPSCAAAHGPYRRTGTGGEATLP